MERWSAESTNPSPLHHSVWDHAGSKEMTNRRTGSGCLSPELSGVYSRAIEVIAKESGCLLD